MQTTQFQKHGCHEALACREAFPEIPQRLWGMEGRGCTGDGSLEDLGVYQGEDSSLRPQAQNRDIGVGSRMVFKAWA